MYRRETPIQFTGGQLIFPVCRPVEIASSHHHILALRKCLWCTPGLTPPLVKSASRLYKVFVFSPPVLTDGSLAQCYTVCISHTTKPQGVVRLHIDLRSQLHVHPAWVEKAWTPHQLHTLSAHRSWRRHAVNEKPQLCDTITGVRWQIIAKHKHTHRGSYRRPQSVHPHFLLSNNQPNIYSNVTFMWFS